MQAPGSGIFRLRRKIPLRTYGREARGALKGRAFGVSRSGLYDHAAKAQRPRRLQDKELAKEIELLFSQSRCTYGAGRLQQMLRRKAIRRGRKCSIPHWVISA
jgi:hypothetical protein